MFFLAKIQRISIIALLRYKSRPYRPFYALVMLVVVGAPKFLTPLSQAMMQNAWAPKQLVSV
jgi:hypothetical protein